MTDGAPWLLTVVLGSAGWFVTHTVDRVTSSPTIEYSLTTSSDPVHRAQIATLELTNLTRDRAFEDLSIDFLGQCGGRVGKGTATPVQPADDGETSPTADGSASSFKIARMQPGNVYRLSVPFAGSASPRVRITSEKSIIRVIPPSWETRFARNELGFLFLIGLVAVASLARYAHLSSRKGDPDPALSPHVSLVSPAAPSPPAVPVTR